MIVKGEPPSVVTNTTPSSMGTLKTNINYIISFHKKEPTTLFSVGRGGNIYRYTHLFGHRGGKIDVHHGDQGL